MAVKTWYRASGVVGAVHDKTDGNPFFVQEVVKHLVETGALVERSWSLMPGTPRIGPIDTTGLLGAISTTSASAIASPTPGAGLASSTPT